MDGHFNIFDNKIEFVSEGFSYIFNLEGELEIRKLNYPDQDYFGKILLLDWKEEG